ncbi:hypothetical protein HMPREF1015_02429 [Bacillus smithii 7_3_47FAA]|uniref:Uncharacterized protein n=1 Tax=Bacillus smithii 7_3_47FAA TaxID=665952 RepID=G9QL19_9BACI|nr:hypothetical protein HMPREF1015_02429 [Bacillus smithii 7_3_47FAA]
MVVAAAKAEEHEKRGVSLQRTAFRRDIITTLMLIMYNSIE